MRTIVGIVLAVLVLLSGSALAQQEPIDCQDSKLGLATRTACELVDRIDNQTILRRFSVEDGSAETYSKKEFVEDLIGGISVERRLEVEDGTSGHIHLSFASRAVCGLQEGRVNECIGSIPQRNNGATCRQVYVSSEDGFALVMSLLICPVVTGWGTGFVEGGEIYLISGNPLIYVGYFPTFSKADVPTQGIEYQIKSNDRLGPSEGDRTALLDRCIKIILGPATLTRCEKYEISPSGSVASLQGVSSFNAQLGEAYRSLIDVKP